MKFKDTNGQEWDIEFTIGAMFRIKKESKIDLLEPRKDELAVRLETDIIYFWEALWHVVSPQAEAIGVTAEQFAEAMGPEHLIAARDAFFEEWIAFFRRLRRPDEETALTKLQSLQKTAVEVVRKRAEEELATLQETFGKELDEHLSKLLANSPGWLESIQSLTPGENSTPAQTESAKLAA
jgi:hypothetical protein